MRTTYRSISNRDYWAQRWEDIPADAPMGNPDAYPLKYAEMIVQSKENSALLPPAGA